MLKRFFIFLLCFICTSACVRSSTGEEVQFPRMLGLEDCIELALENNRRRPASILALEIAEAQYMQAMSGFFPQVGLKATYQELNRDPVFVFPSENTVSRNTVLSGPGLGFGDTITLARVGEKTIKLADRRNTVVSFDLMYPLYTGGVRSALLKQASSGIKAAKEEVRRTDLQVIYDVKRMYYGTVLARELYKIARDALSRLEVTLELTENLYKRGSGRVKKTDYLRNKTIVEALRSAVASLKSNKEVARSALVNTMGLEWNTGIELSDTEIPYAPYDVDLAALVSDSYMFNPDWAKLEAGLEAAEAKIKEEEGGFGPKVAFTGTLNYWANPYKYGMAAARNKETWTVGFAVEFPIFDGFLTASKVREARARLRKLKQEQILLKEGLALQVKHLFLRMSSAQEQYGFSLEAAKAAEENRELNVRAYQDGLVETKDVIEAQIMESFMQAQHQKALYDHLEAKSNLDFVIGEEVSKILKSEKQ